MSGTKPNQIHLYAYCWNEAKMIPYFFRHYNGLVDRFFIYDNGSTDGSLELLAGDERVSVIDWRFEGDSFVEAARDLCNRCWKQSRGKADWVITADMDEHLYPPDLRGLLDRRHRDGITAIKPIGYEMIADSFPTEQKPLWQLVKHGIRSLALDKFAVFDPSAISETNYEPGRHKASPEGRVVWDSRREILLLHYKHLGPAYMAERNRVLSPGIRPGDVSAKWGTHYLRSYDEVVKCYTDLKPLARSLPWLESQTLPEPNCADELGVVSESGLFDREWYVAEYPDIAVSGADPVEHFCVYGWREGRKPNPHFDPRWYRSTYSEAVGPNTNPLFDYITAGEQVGRKPVPYFDPVAYREKHRLDSHESALRHFLQSHPHEWASVFSRLLWRFGIGIKSRLPAQFDARLYLEANPDVARAGMNPRWHYAVLGKSERRPLKPSGPFEGEAREKGRTERG